MPYTKEQLREYYQANKAKLNQQRAERRKLTRLRQDEVETVPQVETIKVETAEKVETGLSQREVETIPLSPPKKVETTKL